MKKLVFLMFFLIIGCTYRPIINVNGLPILNNIVSANITNNNIKVDYALIRYYEEKEDDEYLNSYEYLQIIPYKKHTIYKKKTSKLVVEIYIQNPNKVYYEFYSDFIIKSKLLEETRAFKLIYSGNLSRKSFILDLHLIDEKEVSFSSIMMNDNNMIIFKTFDITYITKGG